MPNGLNCMSLLYRHLVIPDLAPPTCESNHFLFCGGTVTSSSNYTPVRRKARSRPNFASCSILARSAANCRLLGGNLRSELRPCATFFQTLRRDRQVPRWRAKSGSSPQDVCYLDGLENCQSCEG